MAGRSWRLTAALLAAIVSLPVPPTRAQRGDAPLDLANLLSVGPLLEDRNGDGFVDFVTARLALGASPSPALVSAAADVAARLGFETSAIDLPLARGPAAGQLTVAIGLDGVSEAGVNGLEVDPSSLAPGQGVVTGLSGDRPTLVIAGADDRGTRAAARAFAEHLPYVGTATEQTLETLLDDVRQLLTTQGVALTELVASALVAAIDEPDLARVEVHARVPGADDLQRARALLERLGVERPSAETADDTAPLSYANVRTLRVHLIAPQADTVAIDVARAQAPAPEPLGPRPGMAAKERLDLSSLLSNDGLLGDSDENLIPDRLDSIIVPDGPGTGGVVDLAARLGLEGTGLTLPAAALATEIAEPEKQPTLVIAGTAHPLLDRLVEAGALERPAPGPGQGLIRVVKRAFGEKPAVVVTGGDERGLGRALEQMAERLPHIWSRGKDRTTIDDVEEDLRRLVGGRSPAGQAATALYKLDQLINRLDGTDLEAAHVTLHVEGAEEGLADLARERVAPRLGSARLDVTVDDLDVRNAKPVELDGRQISETFDVPSEVETFWQVLRQKVVTAVVRDRPIHVEVRLSEPPEVRRRIATRAREELIAAGAAPAGVSVTVLSAYKQGFSWLQDVVAPSLQDEPVDRITVRFAEAGPPPEWRQQAMYPPTRWLLELFPIDEILSRDLGLPLERIRFEKQPVGSPTYEVVATRADGAELLRERFEPKFVVRPYFDRFPDYEMVRVTTGWVTATVGGEVVADERIVTDLEWFWDRFQAQTLPAVYDYVMSLTEGKPRPEDAPHFGELTVEVSLSEPDYALGIDQERISPLEALHEDIYFGTLHFFDVLGRNARGEGLDYPGRVIPIVRPKADGAAGRATITFTGFGSPRPRVAIDYTERGGQQDRVTLDVPRVQVERPVALAALVEEGRDGLLDLELWVKVDGDRDEREALVRRARAERVDRTIMSAEQATAVISNLQSLRAAGLYRDALAYHDLERITVRTGWTHHPDAAQERSVSLAPNGEPGPFPDIAALAPAGYRHQGEPIVQWDTPIPPPEAYAMLAKMATFPEATVYKLGESYLGKDVWAMDLMAPIDASHWSQMKATALKPTIVYSARQHANEVSSTSHVLRFAEEVLTEPERTRALARVNLVIHPITNPDGAQLAYDLYRITPDHLLHAGYLGALGVDVTANQWEGDPVYPETALRPKLWRTWLPDVFLNPHGYPSHEWVQLFSEYAGWVRNRVTESRDWWGMRGWFTPGFSFLDDPKYPRHKAAAFRIRELFSQAINGLPEVRALNTRAYARYERYGFAFDTENFKLDFTNDVLIYSAIKGATADPRAADFMARHPKVTIWTGSTEAPDETAHGEWLHLVASAGLAWDRAILEYVLEGDHRVKRTRGRFFGGRSLSLDRARPPEPPAESDTPETPGRGGGAR